MSIDDKKINIEDISFDDMLGEGIEDAVETVEEVEPKAEEGESKSEEVLAEASLDDDVAAKQEETEEEEEDEDVKEKVSKKSTKKEVSTEDDGVEAEQVEDDTIVGAVLSKLGYEVDETYDDTTEGLVELTKDIGVQMADENLDKLFEKFPLVKDHMEYVMAGGNSQDFMGMHDPRQDYSRVNMSKDDVQLQKYFLGEYFKTKGHDAEFIGELLEDYEDNGKLYSKAASAQKALVNAQATYRKNALEQQKQEQIKQQKEQKQFWDDVYETIDTSQDFKGLAVPEKEKNKFFEYLSKPVTKEGYTQRDLDHSESDMNTKLAIDYLMFKGFNLDKMIDVKARTKSTRTLKDKIKSQKASVKNAKSTRRATRAADVDIDDLDLNLF
tara:strand:+ start:318 stop:1466 length:1149 start_codon:yes stop_codon:yes gene_type:complete